MSQNILIIDDDVQTLKLVGLAEDLLEEMLRHDFAGVIPPAPELAFESVNQNKPMVVMDLDGFADQQYRTIAEYLTKILW